MGTPFPSSGRGGVLAGQLSRRGYLQFSFLTSNNMYPLDMRFVEKGNELWYGKISSYLEKNIAVPFKNKRNHSWGCSEGCSALEHCCKPCMVFVGFFFPNIIFKILDLFLHSQNFYIVFI